MQDYINDYGSMVDTYLIRKKMSERKRKAVRYTAATIFNLGYVYLAYWLLVKSNPEEACIALYPYFLAGGLLCMVLCSFGSLFKKQCPVPAYILGGIELGLKMGIFLVGVGYMLMGVVSAVVFQLLQIIFMFGEGWEMVKLGGLLILRGLGVLILSLTFLFDYSDGKDVEISSNVSGPLAWIFAFPCFLFGFCILVYLCPWIP